MLAPEIYHTYSRQEAHSLGPGRPAAPWQRGVAVLRGPGREGPRGAILPLHFPAIYSGSRRISAGDDAPGNPPGRQALAFGLLASGTGN